MPALLVLLRALLVAALTAGVAFGLLAVFEPFAAPVDQSGVPAALSSDALRARIDAARNGLAETEAALDTVNATSLTVSPRTPDATLRAQYEAQIAAASERRDLARRHAAAIREGLETGLPLASLAEIRDSIVIGQLLSQQAALDAEIAEQGARFKASHPVMRALLAQRDALTVQIRAQATSIAAALESEADLDDKQVKLLQSQLEPLSAASTTRDDAPTTSVLETRAAAQRAELDALMDAYFKSAAATQVTAVGPARGLNLLNLFVVAVAGLAALVFQVASSKRRRAGQAAADLAAWQADRDDEPELPLETPNPSEAARLRRAS